ncbi:MAG: hypothetical protein ACRENE_09360, partial [Polyangiaceae bacterium]
TPARAEPTKDECADADESAQALRASGHLRDAKDKLAVCIDPACPGPVRKDCTVRLDEVQRALPTVVFRVRGPGGEDLRAVGVRMDATLLTPGLAGGAIAVDPGAHRFAFDAAGYDPVQQDVLVQEGEKERTIAVVLRATGSPPAGDDDHGRATRRWIAVAGLGAGAVALGTGGVLAWMARSQYDTASGETGGSRHDDSVSAVDRGNLATVFVAVGGALAVGGAVLWITTPSPSVHVAVGPGQVSLGGAF